MNSLWTTLVRSVAVIGVTLILYGVVVSAIRIPLLSAAVAAGLAGVGLAWALFGE